MVGQIHCLRLELETRLSMEVTPAMDVWPWLMRHAGWLLEWYHVKCNKKTAFEDCFGKPYQGEVMKFAEAALFRMAVPPCGRVRSEIRQDRADARFVRGMWLGKTAESDEHLFATDSGVYTTRTVTRVPDTEPRRADLVNSLQGTLWDRLAGRRAGRPRKTAPQAPPVATPPAVKASERLSEDASERRSAKRKTSLFWSSFMSSKFFAQQTDKENEPSSASGPTDTDRGGAHANPASDEDAQVRSWTPARAAQMTERIRATNGVMQPASQPEQSKSNMSSGVKRYARAAELPDEDEQGGKFQQVEGLATVDAEIVPGESLVEDDFVVVETAEMRK